MPVKEREVSVKELVEAINDSKKAEALMSERGWTRDDLLARAASVTKQLSDDISAVNMV